MVVMKKSEGQWMSLSLQDNGGQSVWPLPPTFSCVLYEAIVVSPLEKNDQFLIKERIQNQSFTRH